MTFRLLAAVSSLVVLTSASFPGQCLTVQSGRPTSDAAAVHDLLAPTQALAEKADTRTGVAPTLAAPATSVPEPKTNALMLAGLVAVGVFAYRRRS